jgi:hypothetical protein
MEVLEHRFATIGARVKMPDGPRLGLPTIDIRRDGRGEYFELRFPGGGREVALEVVDIRPSERHLLLLVRDGAAKSKFLCGHDERHWFVAAVPEGARGVTGVREAMRALQPVEVRSAVNRKRPKKPLRRKNEAYVRQGEWFFVPEPGMVVDERVVLRDEPITRGRGKPHVVEQVYRFGGEVVYVSRRHPHGLSEAAFARLSEGARRQETWDRMVRNAAVFARGAVRHPDHATIVLRGWHRVAMNTEHRAVAMRHVAFLD